MRLLTPLFALLSLCLSAQNCVTGSGLLPDSLSYPTAPACVLWRTTLPDQEGKPVTLYYSRTVDTIVIAWPDKTGQQYVYYQSADRPHNRKESIHAYNYCLQTLGLGCLEGSGEVSLRRLQRASCVNYRTYLLLSDDTPVEVRLTVAGGFATYSFYTQDILGTLESFPLAEDGLNKALFLYNGTIDQIRKREGF